MALTKQVVIDKIEVLENNSIQVRRATYIVEDGVRLPNPTFSRVSYIQGQNITSEDSKVKAIAASVWP